MNITAETIDPASMTEKQFSEIASRPELVQAYAARTLAEVSAAVRDRWPDADRQERTERTYDSLTELVWERLKWPTPVRQVMDQTGEFAQIYERDRQLSAEKEERKMLDYVSMQLDMPRTLLAPLNFGAAFYNRENDGITVAQLSMEGIVVHDFKSAAQFVKWAESVDLPKKQALKAVEIIDATKNLANMTNTQAAPAPETKTIGALMPKAQWAEARDAVSAPGQTNGKVYLPKSMNEYAGKIVHMTETHLVQQVGKNSAVVHDLTRLENGKDLAAAFDEKKIGPRTNIVIRYNEDRGAGEVVPFNAQRAAEVKKEGVAWAEQNIASERTRAMFVKHLEAFTADMAKGSTWQPARSAAAAPRAPDRAPQLERQR
jgi:hypothetical protein